MGYLEDQEVCEEMVEHLDHLVRTGGCCLICGHHIDLHNLQLHHVAGRKHDPLTVTLCRNCHDTITLGQNHWPSVWLKSDLPAQLHLALMLRGQADLLQLGSAVLHDYSVHVDELTASSALDLSHRLRSPSIRLRQLSDQIIKEWSI